MNFFWSRNKAVRAQRQRLILNLEDTLTYAVGDVHGCHRELLALEEKIEADAVHFSGPRLIIMLGDYVDRGPASSSVLSHLLKPPPQGFKRICLAGNHEIAMLDCFYTGSGLSEWMMLGADTTLSSYGLDPIDPGKLGSRRKILGRMRRAISAEHIRFLRDLPIMIETPRFVFVHAGIRPGISLDRQSDNDLTRIRSDFLDYPHGLPQWIVHGHTPVPSILPEQRKLNIDTGVYYSGCLSAVRIWRGKGHIIAL